MEDFRIVYNRKSEAEAIINVLQARLNTEKLDESDWLVIVAQTKMLLNVVKAGYREAK